MYLGRVPSPRWAIYGSTKHALQGFFGSLREEFIFNKKDISVTVCYLALIGKKELIRVITFVKTNLFATIEDSQSHFIEFSDTENVMNIFGNLYDMYILEIFFPRNSPSDAALAVIKGGAQQVEDLYYPYS